MSHDSNSNDIADIEPAPKKKNGSVLLDFVHSFLIIICDYCRSCIPFAQLNYFFPHISWSTLFSQSKWHLYICIDRHQKWPYSSSLSLGSLFLFVKHETATKQELPLWFFSVWPRGDGARRRRGYAHPKIRKSAFHCAETPRKRFFRRLLQRLLPILYNSVFPSLH